MTYWSAATSHSSIACYESSEPQYRDWYIRSCLTPRAGEAAARVPTSVSHTLWPVLLPSSLAEEPSSSFTCRLFPRITSGNSKQRVVLEAPADVEWRPGTPSGEDACALGVVAGPRPDEVVDGLLGGTRSPASSSGSGTRRSNVRRCGANGRGGPPPRLPPPRTGLGR